MQDIIKELLSELSALRQLPVVLQGEVGSGKCYLIRELARLSDHKGKVIELNVDYRTDAKSLFGSFICSDVPGEFVWNAGILTLAAVAGDWVILRDIDKAPIDVIASMLPLLERRRIPNEAQGIDICVKETFRFFGTRSVLSGSSVSVTGIEGLRHLSYLWVVVPVPSPPLPHIRQIIAAINPILLEVIVDKLLLTYEIFTQRDSHRNKNDPIYAVIIKFRSFTLRDLLKVAGRIAVSVGPSLNQVSRVITHSQALSCLQEIVDVFAASIRDRSEYEAVLVALGQLWEVGESEVVSFIIQSNPQLQVISHSAEPHTDANRREPGVAEHNRVVGQRQNYEERSSGTLMLGRVSLSMSESRSSSMLSSNTVYEDLQDTATSQMVIQTDNSFSSSASSRSSNSTEQYALTKYALRLLESVASCVSAREPVLLVGETGSGKTTSVQELANILGRKLLVQNLSLSTDTSDLLGGFRPVTMRQLLLPHYEAFVVLFQETFSNASNSEFLQVVVTSFRRKNWRKVVKAFQKASDSAIMKLRQAMSTSTSSVPETGLRKSVTEWENFRQQMLRVEKNLPKIENGFAFMFVDGLLVKAIEQGHWVLLDEINLASPETLQALSGLLDGSSADYFSPERPDAEPIKRHPNFRLFAAMNPPTDVGKRELPPSIRNRFTEIYTDELTDPADLSSIVERVLSGIESPPVEDIVNIYLGCRASSELSDSHGGASFGRSTFGKTLGLIDSSGQRPHFSLRSLTRALKAARSFLALGLRPLNRALFEGFLLNFQTLLAQDSRQFMWSFLKNSFGITDNAKGLNAPPSRPGGKKTDASERILVKPFWLRAGPLKTEDWAAPDAQGITKFVVTKSVEASIRDLCAAVAANVAPVLLQGPTAVGKTTMIEYLAARTGHKCVRINNHEHTDVQEYLGGYASNLNGQLEFKDGLLVEALRNGHWIILDELNLAPSDVLEALNRLLDDNKELLIPETGELIYPAPGFTLFATQNPPGSYGGRKVLSRAFRNRFLEIAVTDLPMDEIEDIVTQSCGIAPKFSKMLVKVMYELQLRRQQSNLFQGKYGLVTTRDLIKWGKRQPQNALEVARDGFMLLAEKLRSEEQKKAVLDLLNEISRANLRSESLYCSSSDSSGNPEIADLIQLQNQLRNGTVTVEGVNGIAVTKTICRLWTLVTRSLKHKEPVLLIGDTGTGKTTICQLYAAFAGQEIQIVNCHQSTETADIIGGLRPVRSKDAIFKKAADALRRLSGALLELCNQAQIWGFSGQKYDIFPGVGALEAIKNWPDSSCLTSDYLSPPTSEAAPEAGVTTSVFKEAVDNLSPHIDSFLAIVKKTAGQREKAASTSLGSAKPQKKKAKVEVNNNQQLSVEAMEALNTPKSPLLEFLLSKHVQAAALQCFEGTAAAVASLWDESLRDWSRYNALFEWQDGPLIRAMKEGSIFVLDEINLAEDAVIERLNSVLESGRGLTLAESGGLSSERIIAHPDFQVLATMNPSGDFGKRELSPALRSRFTEIYVPTDFNEEDIVLIVSEILAFDRVHCLGVDSHETKLISIELAKVMIRFMRWLNESSQEFSVGVIKMSVRDVLAWAKFVFQWILASSTKASPLSVCDDGEGDASTGLEELRMGAYAALLHGIHMVLLDGLGIGLSCPRYVILKLKDYCLTQLLFQCPNELIRAYVEKSISPPNALNDRVVSDLALDYSESKLLTLGSFSITCGQHMRVDTGDKYVLNAQSTVLNLWRLLRAMQVHRPILLEGPPGVGKSSLIANLASISGHRLVRINLSEHSEISDLLGTDLPAGVIETVPDHTDGQSSVPDAHSSSHSSPKFKWCDGEFLSAMKRGDWVLLDELNLAPQSVLEGLNACFDHRGEVYLPEIGRSVHCAASFRVFCAQNPMAEGGGRKGLPQSFLSRFSRVFVEAMSEGDMRDIALQTFLPSAIPPPLVSAPSSSIDSLISSSMNPELREQLTLIVSYILRLQKDIVAQRLYGKEGSPWEFNLRDVLRWGNFIESMSGVRYSDGTSELQSQDLIHRIVAEGAYLFIILRLRSHSDREKACDAFAQVFGRAIEVSITPLVFNLEWSPQTENDDSTEIKKRALQIGSACVDILLDPQFDSDAASLYPDIASSLTASSYRLYGGLMKPLEAVAKCITLNWPVLLVGKSGLGKRRLVRHLAMATSHRLVEFAATTSTDSTELLGSFEQASPYRYLAQGIRHLESAIMIMTIISEPSPTDENDEHVVTERIAALKTLGQQVESQQSLLLPEGQRLFALIQDALNACTHVLSLSTRSTVYDSAYRAIAAARANFDRSYSYCSAAGNSVGFEWCDGIFVRALESGHWLLIDNINLCSASVLDRLNSVLEPNGTLLLTESGTGRVIRAHPDFRVFFCMDPSCGEISRAMRNRCVEIALLNEPDVDAFILSKNRPRSATAAAVDTAPASGNEVALVALYKTVMNGDLAESQPSDNPCVKRPDYPRFRFFQRFRSLVASTEDLDPAACFRLIFPFLATQQQEEGGDGLVQTALVSSREVVASDAVLDMIRGTSALPEHLRAPLLLITAFKTPMALGNSNVLRSLLESTQLRSRVSAGIKDKEQENVWSLILPDETTESAVDYSPIIKKALCHLVSAFCTLYSPDDDFQAFSDDGNVLLALKALGDAGDIEMLKLTVRVCTSNELFRALFRKFEYLPYAAFETDELYQRVLISFCRRVAHTGNSADAATLGDYFRLKLLDIVLFARLPILMEEQRAYESVREVVSLSSASQLSSLYAVGRALALERLSATSKDLKLLLATFATMNAVDTFLEQAIISDFKAFFSGEQFENSNDSKMSLITHALSVRDWLVKLLLDRKPPLTADNFNKRAKSDAFLPWEKILILMKWLYKAVLKLHSLPLSIALDSVFAGVIERFAGYHRILIVYFDVHGNGAMQAMSSDQALVFKRLWNEGGHAAVPSERKDWELLMMLQSMASPLSQTLPSFYDSDVEMVGVNDHFIPSHASYRLLKDWTCLMCTLYLAVTNQCSPQATKNSKAILLNNLHMSLLYDKREQAGPRKGLISESIVIAMEEHFHRLQEKYKITRDSTFQGTDSFTLDALELGNGGDSMLLFDSYVQDIITRERSRSGELSITAILEPLVISSFLHLRSMLSRAILLQRLAEADAAALTKLLSRTISITLRYTKFDPSIIFDLQSLQWCLDAIDFRGPNSSANDVRDEKRAAHASFFALVRSVQSTMDTVIYNISAQNIFNTLSISFAYDSATLATILDVRMSATELEAYFSRRPHICKPWSFAAGSGVARLLQPSGAEILLRHLDIAALSPSPLSRPKEVLFATEATINVSNCKLAHSRLLQLFRSSVYIDSSASRASDSSYSSPPFGSDLLGRISADLIDILMSCRSVIFNSSVPSDNASDIAVFERHVRQYRDTSGGKGELLEIFRWVSSLLKRPDLVGVLASALGETIYHTLVKAAELLCTCLDAIERPILEQEIGRLFVLVGLIRVHLLIPPVPIDPATRPALKASLLACAVTDKHTDVLCRHYVSSLSGGPAINPRMIELAGEIAREKSRILSFESRATQRPTDCPTFEELFDELRGALYSLCDIHRVCALVDRTIAASDYLKDFDSTQSHKGDGASGAALFDVLKACAMEEISWQGSVGSFVTRIQRLYFAYTDITSPLLSAVQNVSFGLRLVVGPVFCLADSAKATGSIRGNENICRWWKHVLNFPFAVSIELTSISSLTESAVGSIREILNSSTAVISKSANDAVELAAGAKSLGKRISPGLIFSIAPQLSKLLVLAKIDYLCGNESIRSDRIYDLFVSILEQFSEMHVKAQREKRRADSEKAALYRHKKQESTFESNEEKEEEEALRQHFPDHLAELIKRTNAQNNVVEEMNVSDDSTDAGNERLDSDENHEDHKTENDAAEEAVMLDNGTIESLIGFFSRMILFHRQSQMTLGGLIWKRKTAGKQLLRSDAERTDRQKKSSYFSALLAYHSLTAAKALEGSLVKLHAPGLDCELRGGALMALSMLSRGIVGSASAGRPNSSSATVKHLPLAHSIDSAAVDRDLLLLLDPSITPAVPDLSSSAQEESPWKPSNFHADPCPEEAVRATEALERTFQRAASLLILYPGNEFLLQVCRMTAVISGYHLSTPLGKMLGSIELLLRTAEEWEKYAAKHSSLHVELELLRALVIRWRKIELRSWEHLLRCKELSFAQDAMKYWFQLAAGLQMRSMPAGVSSQVSTATTLHHNNDVDDNGSSDFKWTALAKQLPSWAAGRKATLAKEEERDGVTVEVNSSPDFYLESIFDIVDSFLHGSVVGQFPTRLQMVRVFALQLKQESSLGDSGKVSQEGLADVVYGVWSYYQQYLPIVRGFQEKLKKPLQDKMRDQVKIGKWDQLSSYALIEHSERVHRQLNRLIREYQSDVLEHPVLAVIRRDIMGDLASDQGELISSTEVPPVPSIFPWLPLLGDVINLPQPDDKNSDETQQQEEELGASRKSDPLSPQSKRQRKVSKSKYKRKVQAIAKATARNVKAAVDKDAMAASLRNVTECIGFSDECIPTANIILEVCKADMCRSISDIAENIQLSKFVKAERLRIKMDKYLSDTMSVVREDEDGAGELPFLGKCRYGAQASEKAEDLCDEIFARIASLRGSAVDKAVKQRAVGDLLNGLKEEGIPWYKHAVPSQAHKIRNLVSSPAPLPCEVAGDLLWTNGVPRDQFEKAERYHLRNLAELSQLRAQTASAHSKDVSQRELQLMLGLSENMFFVQLRARAALGAALQDIRTVVATAEEVRDRLEVISITLSDSTMRGVDSSTFSEAFLLQYVSELKSKDIVSQVAQLFASFVRPGLQVLLDSVQQLQQLLTTAAQAQRAECVEEECVLPLVQPAEITFVENTLHKVSSTLEGFISTDEPYHESTGDAHDSVVFESYQFGGRTGASSSFLTRSHALEVLHSAFDHVSQAASIFSAIQPQLGALISHACTEQVALRFGEFRQALERNLVSFSISSPTESVYDSSGKAYVLLSSCIEACLIAVQKLRTLAVCRPSTVSAMKAAATSGGGVMKGCFGEILIPQQQGGSQDEDSLAEATLHECSVLNLSALSSVAEQIQKVNSTLCLLNAELIASTPASAVISSVLSHAFIPLYRRVLGAFLVLVRDTCGAYKSNGKLLYVCLRVFRTLLAKGICSAESEEGDGEGDGSGAGNMTFQDDVDGTGMGEGDGKKDVSDQIQNEDQLMGLKEEKKEEELNKPPPDDTKTLREEEKDQGVEMSQDFEGEFFDLPEEGNEDDTREDEDEDDEAEELDREMGEADMEDIVDEKQWDEDEDGKEPEDRENEQMERDSEMKGDKIEGEMATRDNGDDDKGKDQDEDADDNGEEKKDTQSKDPGVDEHDEDEAPINEDSEDKYRDKPLGVDVDESEKSEENEEGDQGEDDGRVEGEKADDFPDDLKLDGGGDDGDEQGDDDESDAQQDDLSDEDGANDTNIDGSDDEQKETAEEEREENQHMAAGGSNIPDAQPEEEDEKQSNPEEENPETDDSAEPPPKGDDSATFGVASKVGKDSVLPTSENEKEDESSDHTDDDINTDTIHGPQGGGGVSEGHGDTGDQQDIGGKHSEAPRRPNPRRERSPPNPFRQKGDLAKKWQRRLNIIDGEENEDDDVDDDEAGGSEDTSKEQQHEKENENKRRGLYEKVLKDEADQGTEQVLDDAEDGEAMQLDNREENEMNPSDEVDDGIQDEKGTLFDEDDAEAVLPSKKCQQKKRKHESDDQSDAKKMRESVAIQKDNDAGVGDEPRLEEAELMDDEIQGEINNGDDDIDRLDVINPGRDGTSLSNTAEMIHSKSDYVFGDETIIVDEDDMSADEGLALIQLSGANNPDAATFSRARELWSRHRAATDSHATRLCEQLRLILEPTLASRLQGDYRTGKRINMRKVIGYVASGFRKDKIWLRRTKPAKREYQVMIMIDNSSSMSVAGPLALSALTMISNALTRLEVGDLCVVSFADAVKVVHAFGKPFNDEAGASVFSHFDFHAQQTLLGASLETVLPIFAAARASSSGASLGSAVVLQLCFVVSDARLDSDNRTRLDNVVRKLAEEHVLVVLIIVDHNENACDSIFNTKTVEFRGDKIHTSSYLDNFPFPYYVAIQQVDGLPDVLSDALKQWFEMIGAQLNAK